jgi:hypothetical protein
MAVIVVNVGSGDGRLRPLWSLLMEAAVGWSRRMEPTAPIVVIDSGGKDAIAAAAIDRRRI